MLRRMVSACAPPLQVACCLLLSHILSWSEPFWRCILELEGIPLPVCLPKHLHSRLCLAVDIFRCSLRYPLTVCKKWMLLVCSSEKWPFPSQELQSEFRPTSTCEMLSTLLLGSQNTYLYILFNRGTQDATSRREWRVPWQSSSALWCGWMTGLPSGK